MRILTVNTDDKWVSGAALNRAMQNATAQPSPTLGYTVVLGYRHDGAVSEAITEDIITIKCATRRYDEAW